MYCSGSSQLNKQYRGVPTNNIAWTFNCQQFLCILTDTNSYKHSFIFNISNLNYECWTFVKILFYLTITNSRMKR